MSYRISACPFCGNPPETFGSGEGRRGLMIECMTDGCVNPHVSYYDRATAVVRWNNRIAGPRITVEDAEILKASAL